jgi:hypothetical protein
MALIFRMRGRIEDLREQLEAERQAHAKARRLIAGLVDRSPAIEAPQESSEAAEMVQEDLRSWHLRISYRGGGSGSRTAALVAEGLRWPHF